MPKLLNSAVKVYLKLVHGMLERSITAPIEAQEKVFNKLIFNFKNTKYGKLNGIKHVKNYESYHKAYPVVTYDHLKPFIERMMKGESDVLIGGNVRFFRNHQVPPTTKANLFR